MVGLTEEERSWHFSWYGGNSHCYLKLRDNLLILNAVEMPSPYASGNQARATLTTVGNWLAEAGINISDLALTLSAYRTGGGYVRELRGRIPRQQMLKLTSLLDGAQQASENTGEKEGGTQ